MRMFVSALLALVIGLTPAIAVEPDEMLADPALEQRARDISKGLRCLVCRNQSIDDSDAGLARDLRVVVRERIGAGDSDSQVIDYVVSRYGEYVLLKPRFSATSAVLYLGGPLLLILGGVAAWRVLRRRPETAAAPRALAPEEEARLRELTARDQS